MEGEPGFVSMLFQGEECLGEMLVLPQEGVDPSRVQALFGSKICFSFLSPSSERGLHPLTCLPTIASPPAPLFKMCSTEAQAGTDSLRLDLLHKSCLEESKTAVVLLDDANELHLVAMGSTARGNVGLKHCFWAILTREGMYASCLGMLNLRCLAMVFDLDETLIVANTMRSFENRVELLERRLYGSNAAEMDPMRRTGMMAELKRYQEDRDLLKQFVDNDQIFDSGDVIEAQGEVVPPLADGALPLVRPIIRLPDRSMVLTRINPSVRDTSVLVRLRPAWEELRGYLIAKGRKRFEVYICTMAEREYALEMWRLLDPDAGLINSRELMERVVCVKSGNKKSLSNVFPQHRCHPNLAMIVDDRLKVWEESDQPQVHVVPAFAPYSSPHAEVNSGLGMPALRVAKNVVCNVRAAFFKHFDETVSQQVPEVEFESGTSSMPMPLDISDCLQAAESKNNFGGHIPSFRGENEEMRAAVNPITSQTMQPAAAAPPVAPPSNVPPLLSTEIISHPLTPEDSRPADVVLPDSFNTHGGELLLPPHHQQQQSAALLRTVMQTNPAQSSSPVREEEGEVPESELDPDTRRRLLILHHGMDTNHTRDLPNFDERSPFSGSGNIPPAGSAVSPYTGGEEEMSPGRPTRTSTEPLALKPESPSFDSQHDLHDIHDLQGPPPGFADGPYLSSNHDRSGGPGPGLGPGPGPGSGPGPVLQDPRRRLPQDSKRFLLEEMNPQTRPDVFSDQQQLAYMGPEGEPQPQALNSRGSTGAGVQQELPLLHVIRQQHQHMNFVEILQVVGDKLSAKVDYKGSLASSSTRLLFNVEVTFNGQKVGEGTGSTKKEARIKAAEAALWFLTSLHPDTFMHVQQLQLSSGVLGGSNPRAVEDEAAMLAVQGGSRDTPRLRPPPGLLGGGPLVSPGSVGLDRGLEMDYLDVANQAGQINFVAILKERCTIQGVNVNFQDLPTTGDASRRFFNCQVEVDRQVLGRGSGLSWEIAKQHAAEEALRQLKRSDTPRSPPVVAAKRVRMGFNAAPSPSSRGGGRRGRGRGRSPPRRRPPGQ